MRDAIGIILSAILILLTLGVVIYKKTPQKVKNYVMNHKKAIAFSAIIILLVLAVVVYKKTHYTVKNADIIIEETGYNPANDQQMISPYDLFVWEGKLYFHPVGSKVKEQYYMELCVFEDNSVRSLGAMEYIRAYRDGCIYYKGDEDLSKLEDFFREPTLRLPLMSYNISTGERTALIEDGWLLQEFKTHYDEDGTCYFSTSDEGDEYYIVKNGQIVGKEAHVQTYIRGDKQYIEKRDSYPGELICINPDGTEEIITELYQHFSRTVIIPCNNGLLVYDHSSCNLLYFIPDDTGELVELFTFEGIHTAGSMNVHGDWVYVSFNRYKEYKDVIGYIPFENDTFEGTYRISLIDYSVEKLSDEVYYGMYIFDDTGIYACKESGIYKLDFDGNVLYTIME